MRSRLDAIVTVQGVALGRTNERIVSRCGDRFIRLASAPGAWINEATTHAVGCRETTVVDIEP